ncbi:hypothetical protein ISCGN_009963 [Ixodes scapularis]
MGTERGSTRLRRRAACKSNGRHPRTVLDESGLPGSPSTRATRAVPPNAAQDPDAASDSVTRADAERRSEPTRKRSSRLERAAARRPRRHVGTRRRHNSSPTGAPEIARNSAPVRRSDAPFAAASAPRVRALALTVGRADGAPKAVQIAGHRGNQAAARRSTRRIWYGRRRSRSRRGGSRRTGVCVGVQGEPPERAAEGGSLRVPDWPGRVTWDLPG